MTTTKQDTGMTVCDRCGNELHCGVCYDCEGRKDIGKPHATPTDRRHWCTIGDTVVATDGPQAMRGIVERVVLRRSIPTATVKWSNGSIGRHTITTLRKIICRCGIRAGFMHSLGTCVFDIVGRDGRTQRERP